MFISNPFITCYMHVIELVLEIFSLTFSYFSFSSGLFLGLDKLNIAHDKEAIVDCLILLDVTLLMNKVLVYMDSLNISLIYKFIYKGRLIETRVHPNLKAMRVYLKDISSLKK